MMSLARDRDYVWGHEGGRGHDLRTCITSAGHGLNPYRLAFADFGREVEESVFDSLPLYQSQTLISLVNDR